MAAYRYWELNVTKWMADGVQTTSAGYVRVAELKLFTAADVKWPQSAMTSASAPSPYVASASSEFAGPYAAYRAFDNNASDSARWIAAGGSAPHRLRVDLGEPVDVTYFQIAPDSAASTGGGNFPIDFQLQASPSGAFSGEQVIAANLVAQTTGWANNTLREYSASAAGYVAPPFGFAFDSQQRVSGRAAPAFPPRLGKSFFLQRMAVYSGPSGQLMVGPGYVAGTLKVLTVPSARRVRLYDMETGVLLRSTMSAADGTYRFDNMALGRKFFAVGHDDNSASPRRKADVADFFEAVQ